MERKHRTLFAVGEGGSPDTPDFMIGSQEARTRRLQEWGSLWPDMSAVFDAIVNDSPEEVLHLLTEKSQAKHAQLDGMKNPPPETAPQYTQKIFLEAMYFALDQGQDDLAVYLREEAGVYVEKHPHLQKELELSLRFVTRSAAHRNLNTAELDGKFWELFGLQAK